MKFYTVHYGVSLDDRNRVLGHFRKLEDAKKVFDAKVNAVREDLGHEFEEEHPREFDVILWYVDMYGERTDDWESVWISEETLQ